MYVESQQGRRKFLGIFDLRQRVFLALRMRSGNVTRRLHTW